MAKLYSILLALLVCTNALFSQCGSTISTFPYVEDFELSNGGWTTSGPANSSSVIIDDWAWGTPSKATISSAGSGVKCWVVGGLTATSYANGERSYVQSPCFNFTSIPYPFIQFKLFIESEYKYDGSNLQTSTDGGITWTNVGSYFDTVDCMDDNWYNYATIKNLGTYTTGGNTYYGLTSVTEGWCGNIQSTSGGCQGGHGSGGWITAKHCLSGLGGQPSVMLRFTFGAGTTCNAFDGIAFDSVAVGNAPANTATFTTSCVNTTTLSFTGSTNLCADTFQWDYGDPSSGSANTDIGLNTTHTFSSPGTYSVKFTVRGGPCNASGSITKTVHILGITTQVTNPKCNGDSTGMIVATVVGNATPYTYQWSTNPIQSSDTAKKLPNGNYTLTVTSANACSVTATATITQPNPLKITATPSSPNCVSSSTGGVSTTVTGGTTPYHYLWNNAATTPNLINITANSYSVVLTDSNHCKDSTTTTVIDTCSCHVLAKYNISNKKVCDSTLVTLTNQSTNALTYQWRVNGVLYSTAKDTTITPLSPGTYLIKLTATAQVGCTDSFTDTLFAYSPVYPNLGADTMICAGKTVKLDATTVGGAYAWSDGTALSSIQVTTAGIYWVDLTVNHCTRRDSIKVDTLASPLAPNLGADTTVCSATINITLGGGAKSYHWSTGVFAPSITVATTGLYIAKDSNSCGTAADSILIKQAGALNIELGNDTAICATHTVMLNATTTNAIGYHWQDNTTLPTLTVTQTGIYAVTVTVGACTSSDSIQVNVINIPTAPSLGEDTTICSPTININLGSGAKSYYWSTGAFAPSITVTTPGLYIAKDSNNCGTAADSITITQANPPTVELGNDTTICGNNTIVLKATTPTASYHWQDNTTLPTFTVSQAGVYAVTVTVGGCTASDSIIVTVGSKPIGSLIDTIACDGDSISLGVFPVNGYKYQWSTANSDTLSFVTVIQSGLYTLTITNGCGSSTFHSNVSHKPCDCKVAIPTAFSPNGDGINEKFGVIPACAIKTFTLHIYNRWGQLIFESNEVHSWWDGTYLGTDQPLGVYAYWFSYVDPFSLKTISQAGNFTLVR